MPSKKKDHHQSLELPATEHLCQEKFGARTLRRDKNDNLSIAIFRQLSELDDVR